MDLNWGRIRVLDDCDNERLTMHRPCPVCGEDDAATVLTFDKFQFFSDCSKDPKQVTLKQNQCHGCGAIYLNPCFSPEGFAILFAEAGRSYGNSAGRSVEQLEWMKKHDLIHEKSRVLDIGCGTGHFLASLPDHIVKAGVDIDQSSISQARDLYPDIEFICSAFDTLEYEDGADVITMFHVLEHLPNPVETLQRLSILSGDNTRLVLEVPIIENGLTNDINGFFSVQHLTHFSRKSFAGVIENSGWEILTWLEQSDYNGCRVLARKKSTPEIKPVKVDSEKANLYRYLAFWYGALEEAQKKISSIGGEKCVIWGAGLHLEFLFQVTTLFAGDMTFILVDGDPLKQGKNWRGLKINSPEIIRECLGDDETVFLISSYGGQKSIKNELLEMGALQEQIVELYSYLKTY